MNYSAAFILSMILLFGFGCSQSLKNDTTAELSFSEKNQPREIYIRDDIKTSVDSLFIYYQHAQHALNFGDSIGARIYYDHIFSIISDFDENKKSVLMEWGAYDSLITNINSDYEMVFSQDLYDQEAEEVLEDLTDYEEEVYKDSSYVGSLQIEVDADTNRVPLDMNGKVERALKYFQTKGRRVFTIWLERSGKYEDMIRTILKEHNLPENLVYLSMIESGFNPKAYSYARASGLWQFISSTGRYYGLRSDWWFDERRDPTLATHAAAKHLRDLNERFEDWYLAMAGYNCNPRRIENRVRVQNTKDFWELTRIPRQTKNYIPTFIAANLIAENPEKYGFYVDRAEPVVFDTVMVSECVDLEVVAQCVDTSFQVIKELNPAAKRWCTPPGVKDFVLNLPVGTKELFKENYAKIPEDKKRSWVRHQVRSGETLSVISQKYGSTVEVLKNYNSIRGSMIYVGDYLLIPVPQNKTYYSYPKYNAKKSKPKQSVAKVVPRGYKKVDYSVKSGDTLGEIAEKFHTLASNIRSWNGLYYGQHIYPKQKLTLWVPENYEANGRVASSAKVLPAGSYHVVKSGDTLWDIAQKYDISISNLKRINNMRSNNIRPGEKLKIREVHGG